MVRRPNSILGNEEGYVTIVLLSVVLQAKQCPTQPIA